MPYFSTEMPPALVESVPPSWQDWREPRSSGSISPASAAASCTTLSTQPASAVSERLAASSVRTAFSRSRLSTSSRPSDEGVAAAQ